MPHGKPAGVRCIQLDEHDRCKLFRDARRPAVCGSLQPSAEMCGDSREAAMMWLTRLERLMSRFGLEDGDVLLNKPFTIHQFDAAVRKAVAAFQPGVPGR